MLFEMKDELLQVFLVLGQFGLLMLLFVFGSPLAPNILTLQLTIAAFIIAGLAFFAKRFSVSVFPSPTKRMQLVTSGIYGYIRHPMYLAVILLGLAWVVPAINIISSVLWIMLVADLTAKIILEERLLIKQFPEYKTYQKKTARLLPFLW